MATIVTRSGKGSPLTNNEVDANFTNLNTELGTKANTSSLAAVAISGAYADLTGKPTNVSSFTNDSGYLTSFTESDPTVPSHVKAITTTNINNWNTAFGWGNHASVGYLTSFTESDPTVPSHVKAITTTKISNWDAAFSWGNHASAGYLTGITSGQVTTALGYTPYDATNPAGYITSSALSPYLTSAAAGAAYQPLDGDLTAIAALAGTTGIVRKTAANTYTLDTASYLTGNQAITLSGDVTGSGSTAITATLSNTGVTAGTYTRANITVDAKGRILFAEDSVGGGGATVATSDTPPANPTDNQFWWDSSTGNLKIYYNDGTSSQWVDAYAGAVASGGGVSYTQNIQNGNYTLVLGDAGKHIYSANTGAQTITIPTNASVAFPIGTIITIVNFGTNAINLSVSGVSVYPNGSKSAVTAPKVGLGTSLQLLKTDANAWNILLGALSTSVTASYLIVAGGASGGSNDTNMGTGGGGSGGLLSGTSTLAIGTTYTITVGAGGATQSGNGNGNTGSNSSALSVTASGGGGGSGVGNGNGVAGGSGGGGSGTFASGNTSGGSGTSGQGSAGGSGHNSAVDADAQVGGGGGGASAVGSAGTGNFSGNGGAGAANSITGSSVTYAGGGGGGKRTAGTAGTGGTGGGGNGGAAGNGSAGTANTGGGGGGAGTGGGGTVRTGGAGGSGVVILSVPTSDYTGITTGSPTVTTSGSNTILQFNSSGSYTA